jgi:predicted nucleic acid-binding protein
VSTAVLDTSALASGVIAERSTLATIVDAWRAGAFTDVVSSPILEELERTLEKSYFAQRLTPA